MNVTAVLYDGFETLDMFGPVEMLGSSGEYAWNDDPGNDPFAR